ncbi:hypothetical protein BGZ49_002152 [Haplosporangium sp. Z 27]|nr:hypothetical protein BGZ49_002152 [Haplosporangium sp. Z 27]
MKREELEHRHRESELYSKIIELQIENANLKGDKEALNRVISNREKMLMEIRVQLQAMEFFCRENNIKVDIEMCSDEVIENWCFKESDEVYQRILFTTQELLRTGSKCLEENTTVGRSSLNLQSRSTRTSSTIPRVTSMDQSRTSGDALLFKETSRPGTLKLDLQSLLRSEQDFDNAKNNRSTVSHSNLAEIDAGIVERDGRRAIDGGDNRSGYFHANIDDEDDGEYDSSDDDGDESQESEFEELGEDMIKYVELQPSMGPRRNSKSSTYSRMNTVSPYNGSSASTPDMSANVLNKTLWSGAARRSGATTPLQNSSSHHQMQLQPRRSGSANRNSGSSFNSNGSLFEDYCARSMESADTLSQTSGAPIGLGIRGNSPSLQRVSMEKFLSTPPSGALPPILAPQYSPALSSSSPPTCQYTQTYSNRSIFSNNSSPVISSQDTSMIMKINKSYNNRNSNSSMTRPMPPPPPMLPLPPLPTYNRLSHPEQAKQDLRESRRPRRGRTSSQEFTIENMGPQAHSKLLAQDLMHRGHQRQISV